MCFESFYFQALAVLCCTDLAAAATVYSFLQIDTLAGGLMAPYLLWLTLATAISYRIVVDNEEKQ